MSVSRVSLVVVVVLGLALALGFGTSTSASEIQTIYAKALQDHECNTSEWHFVITGISSEQLAPASIQVKWSNGATATVSRSKFTGDTAHYTTTANLTSTVVEAKTTIYPGWSGQFNLSHGPCLSTTTVTPVTTTPVTTTPVTTTPVTTTPVPPTSTRVPPTATTPPKEEKEDKRSSTATPLPTATLVPPTTTPQVLAQVPAQVPTVPTAPPPTATPKPVPPTLTAIAPTAPEVEASTPLPVPEPPQLPYTGEVEENPFVSWLLLAGSLFSTLGLVILRRSKATGS